jgi:hypothetical protein
VYPNVLAAHPQEPTQFAVGLNDGVVKVIEPLESNKKWGPSLPIENGVSNVRQLPLVAAAGTSQPSDQIQRWLGGACKFSDLLTHLAVMLYHQL